MDGATNYSILIRALASNTTPSFLAIHDNTGVGYGNDLGFLWLQNFTSFQACFQIQIKNNIGQYYRGTAIKIENGTGIYLGGNTMSAYNSDASTTADPTYQSGCFVGSGATLVTSYGNAWGGAINNPSGANSCVWGIYWQNLAGSGASGLERSLGLG